LISIIFGRYEGELVKIVVSKVLLELKKNYMVVTDNLVGIDHHEEKMMGLLNVGSNDVHIVGIHGMGGIGKTTIAKVIYNKLSVGALNVVASLKMFEKRHKTRWSS
jgi:Holliday junction resolvasome RuvABC ATP-dependent DNA helicase subunit